MNLLLKNRDIEQMTEEIFTKDIHQTCPLLVVISGPSGIGKDTIVRVMENRNLSFHFVVTTTSREPRANEVDGVDYIFVSKERFEEMVANDELIEYAVVYDEYKGVPRKHIKDAFDSGKDVIMRLDVQGAKRIRSLFPEAILIFLAPIDDKEWIERLKKRRTETPEKLQVRISTAREELETLPMFDYIVINADGKLNDTADQITAIINAEHLRVRHRRIDL